MNPDIKKINEEVFYVNNENLIAIDETVIDMLIKQAKKNQRGRSRLCTHKDINDVVHEMLIVHTNDVYVRPHKHIKKIESFYIIKGQCDIIVFKDNGDIDGIIKMGEYGSGRNIYYRLNAPVFHSLIIHSEILVFHETTEGPFNKKDTIYAPWSPVGDLVQDARNFLSNIKEN